jgi:hypothetical protein
MRLRSALAFLLAASCRDGSAADGGGAPAVSYATVKLNASGSSSVTPPTHDQTTICRAIGVTGTIKRESGVPLAMSDVMGDGFVTLAVGARLAIKNGTTTRETIFEGPGDVRACISGEEEMWMTAGTFKSVVGAGETPGSEVWIVTPHGVLRYGSGAQLGIDVSASRAEIRLGSGGAHVYPVDASTVSQGTGVDGWYPVPAGVSITLTSKQSTAQTIGVCEQASKAAHDLAIAIGTHDASLAEAAPRHVVLRQKAHAICSVAELVAARTLDPVERARLQPRAHLASAKWRDSSTNP